MPEYRKYASKKPEKGSLPVRLQAVENCFRSGNVYRVGDEINKDTFLSNQCCVSLKK